MRLPAAQVVQQLATILGRRLVAYLASVKEQRAVDEWARGVRMFQRPDLEQRLRDALLIALFLSEENSREVVQAWFQGVNPHLDDRVPLMLLRDGEPGLASAEVLAAAREFAAA